MEKNIPRTTKLGRDEHQSVLYKYYAGFSEKFVEDIIEVLDLDGSDIILDPWNGSGTTTFVASKKGFNAIGVDMNPIMSIIANARLYQSIHGEDEIKNLLKLSRRYKTRIKDSDALCNWFTIDTVKKLRNIERAIFDGKFLKEVIDKANGYTYFQSFCCLLFFNVVKILANDYKSSNPTWLKRPSESEKRKYKREEIELVFYNEFEKISQTIQQRELALEVYPQILTGHSESLQIESSSVDIVITSPPYCTRIDYAVMTSLELAVLNLDANEFSMLRHSLIGAPVIHKNQPMILNEWGKTCITALNKIKNHNSRASESYYLKTYLQYFNSIYRSLIEIDRVLKHKGRCVVVVQNSFYKEILVDLKAILIEMSEGLGWNMLEFYEFLSEKNLLEINTKSKNYRKHSTTMEYAIVFRKGE